MAFMMPVVKNNYEIYPRSRKNSESVSVNGNGSSSSAAVAASAAAAAAAARRRSSAGSRPVSRTVSESERSNGVLHTGSHFLSASPPLYSSSAPAGTALFVAQHSRVRTVRFNRSSQESGHSSRKSSTSSVRSAGSSSSSSSSSMTTTSGSTAGAAAAAGGDRDVDAPQPESDDGHPTHSPRQFGSAFGKFHSKLVDKLKRKLKLKDTDGNPADGADEDQSTAIRSST